MIREKAKDLLIKLKQGKGSATIFGSSYYDDEIQQIIEIITNECKSTIMKRDGTTKRYESDIYIESVKEIVQQLLTDKNTIKNSIVFRLTSIPQRSIPGITTQIRIEKKVDERGIPYIDIDKPLPDNFHEIISGQINREQLEREVIKPYIARLCKKEKKLTKRHFISRIFNPLSRKEVTNSELIERFENYLRENTNLSEEEIQNTSTYFILNILEKSTIGDELINTEVQGKSMTSKENKRNGYNDMIQNMSNELFEILNIIPNPNDDLEEIKDIYANTVGQLEALGIESERTPELIEKQIKNINRNINRHRQEQYNDNGYRRVDVGISGKDIRLLKKEYVPQAMELYSQSVAQLLEHANEMNEEQYIKEVAKLHYRFIQIHPFPDGNGRTARAISNMLLLEKNIPAVFTKLNKTEYIRQMEGARALSRETGYMEALYTDQTKCSEIEEKSVYKLEEYIGMKCLNRSDLYTDRQITAELPKIEENMQPTQESR